MVKTKKQNRVLILLENSSFPEDNRIKQESTTLARAGYIVSVICPRRHNAPRSEKLEGINVRRFKNPFSGKGLVSYIFEYAYSLLIMFILSINILIRPGFDIIQAANPPDTMVFIAAFYKLFGKKFIFDHHDLSPEIFLLRFGNKSGIHHIVFRLLLFFEKLSCSVANHVIATNDSYKTIEIERDKVPAERITVVRNGPDDYNTESSSLTNEFHQDGKLTLLYLGVIGFQDGVDYLLRSINHLIKTLGVQDFLCIIAGDGQALSSIKNLAEELGLNSHLHFPGWIESSNLPSYIGSADICLAPEPSNELNDRSTIVKIMEYMAAGKPIVAFDLPEHRFTAQSAALYAKPNDELDFARKIQSLMENPELCQALGQIGRERIVNQLAWVHQEKNLLQAYEKLTLSFLVVRI